MKISNQVKEINLEFSFVAVIPECLKGNMPLSNLALFMQVTDKMQHSGLVLLGSTFIQGKQYDSLANEIYFAKNDSYKYHTYPKKWVKLYDNDLIVPKAYAENADLNIYINGDDDYNSLSCGTLSFSHSCGYYDNEDKTIMDHELYDADEVVILHDGTKCHIEDAVYLDYKNDWYLVNDCVYTNNEEYMLEDDCIYLNGDWYDKDSDDLSYCDDCNQTILNDDAHYSEDDYCTYCNDCIDNHSSSRLDRYSYSVNVLNVKGFGVTNLHINKKPVYVGLELECLVTEGYEKEVNDFTSNCDYAVASEDGSLDSSHGVEFIFRPEGLEQQKENVTDLINEIESCLEHREGHYYDADYGLHVHISSHFLGKSSKLKIQNFVNDTFYYLKAIGGRDETTYQDYKSCKWSDLDLQRYRFVNLQNSETVEFRFPAAIICEDHINTNLELAQAVVMFCKFHLSMMLLKHNYKAAYLEFCEYVVKNADQYPLLAIDMKHEIVKLTMIPKAA